MSNGQEWLLVESLDLEAQGVAHRVDGDGAGKVVFIEGAERVTVSCCVFERVDGNAVLLSAYSRNVSITYNEFSWIGQTAVAAWGNTAPTAGADSVMPYGYGADGTNGVDGQSGTNGTNGTDGASYISTLTEEAPGDNCTYGGFLVETGPDADSDGTLDEVVSSTYACLPAPPRQMMLYFYNIRFLRTHAAAGNSRASGCDQPLP
jgi:hypothetical protein